MNDSVEAVGPALEALSNQYHTIAHNLANANTTGFKRNLVQIVEALSGAEPAPKSGGVVSKSTLDLSQGRVVHTGNPLDLAIEGRGFFTLETPEGDLYTRNGAFRVNAQGQLVDSLGRTVAGQGGPIMIPNTVSVEKISVGRDGTISAGGDTIGKIQISDFEKPEVLLPVGGNCLKAPKNVRPDNATSAQVQQGFQEASNVNVMQELVGLIAVTRLYEANLKTISTQDERYSHILKVAME